jgi:hypothetical protein
MSERIFANKNVNTKIIVSKYIIFTAFDDDKIPLLFDQS